MNNQLIEELYKTIEAKDNIINNQALEIARLNKQLNCKEKLTKIMPPDTEFIILSKSDYERQEKDIEEIALEQKLKIDKVIEYINKITIELLEEVEKHKLTPFKETIIGKDLLEILGDKENE